MPKVVVIECCAHCPYIVRYEWGGALCGILPTKQAVVKDLSEIKDGCPLQDASVELDK